MRPDTCNGDQAGELGREFNEVKRTLFLFLAALGQHQMLMKTLLAPGSGPVVMQLLRLVVRVVETVDSVRGLN